MEPAELVFASMCVQTSAHQEKHRHECWESRLSAVGSSAARCFQASYCSDLPASTARRPAKARHRAPPPSLKALSLFEHASQVQSEVRTNVALLISLHAFLVDLVLPLGFSVGRLSGAAFRSPQWIDFYDRPLRHRALQRTQHPSQEDREDSA